MNSFDFLAAQLSGGELSDGGLSLGPRRCIVRWRQIDVDPNLTGEVSGEGGD